ncbi:MAG: F0F1 ATP synthase subunit delta [Pseudomonadota bacterium]
MDNNTVARPYAQAIFEVAQDKGLLDEFSASLTAGRDMLSDSQLNDFLATPSLTDTQRLEFLQSVFAKAVGESTVFAGGSQQGSNFLKLLLENGRVSVLPEIADQFDTLKSNIENKVDVVVTSATTLSDQQVAEISTALSSRLGRDVSIETKIDESLIGGAVITAGDFVIDGSTRARLEGLASALTK